MSDRVLVVGAAGALGGAIARKLLAKGVQVRVLSRRREKLEPLASLGAELVVADMRDEAAMYAACVGAAQVASTASNNLGKGAASPTRVDIPAYRALCNAALRAGVRRLLYVSFRGAGPNTGVDAFRIKWQIEHVVTASGVPYVLLRPSALLDTWAKEIMADGIRKSGKTPIFGDGRTVSNYIAVEDVAEFAVQILARESVRNEAIEVGGPSNLSLNELATLVERALGASGKRRHVPVAALRLLPPIVRPFNEVVARLMTIGHYAARHATPFPRWRDAAERFHVRPMTAEQYVAGLSR